MKPAAAQPYVMVINRSRTVVPSNRWENMAFGRDGRGTWCGRGSGGLSMWEVPS